MLQNLGPNKLLYSFPHADTEDLSSCFSPAHQIFHKLSARVLNCLFELQKEAVRSDYKFNFLVDAHLLTCPFKSTGSVFRQIQKYLFERLTEPVLIFYEALLNECVCSVQSKSYKRRYY